MAGLLAARVLSDTWTRHRRGTRPPREDEHRRGVPQGRHAHLLLPGTQILDELFPGLLDDLAAGGPVVRSLAELRFSPGGHRLCLGATGMGRYLPGQPALSGRPGARPGRAWPRSRSSTGARSSGSSPPPPGTASPGYGSGAAPSASRVSSTPIWSWTPLAAAARGGWLAAIGYDQPPQEQLTIHLKYATRHLRLRPGALPGHKFVAIGAEPDRPTGLVLIAEEQNRWILTLIGYGRHHPPSDPEAFLAFVETIPTRRLHRDL